MHPRCSSIPIPRICPVTEIDAEFMPDTSSERPRVFAMQPEAKAERMETPQRQEFQLCVLAANKAHVGRLCCNVSI
jgi:hypothetical protein